MSSAPRWDVHHLRALPKSPVAQGKDAAAWPAVRALTDPAAEGGQLRGPRLARSKGRPVPERPTALMRDAVTAHRLWAWSEQATGFPWPAQPQPQPHPRPQAYPRPPGRRTAVLS